MIQQTVSRLLEVWFFVLVTFIRTPPPKKNRQKTVVDQIQQSYDNRNNVGLVVCFHVHVSNSKKGKLLTTSFRPMSYERIELTPRPFYSLLWHFQGFKHRQASQAKNWKCYRGLHVPVQR